MVKTVLSVSHRGLTDWMLQRVSAVLMAIYFIGLIIFLICHPHISYTEWRMLFSETWMKVATILILSLMLIHAYIGMWTIFTDYVKCAMVRAFLTVSVLLGLAACFFWGLLILWSV